MNKKLAALAALAIVAIVGSLTYLSQSPEKASQEVGSNTTTNLQNKAKQASSNIVSMQANFVISDK